MYSHEKCLSGSTISLLICDVADMDSSHLPSGVHSACSIYCITKETVARKFSTYDTSHHWTRMDAYHQLCVCVCVCVCV